MASQLNFMEIAMLLDAFNQVEDPRVDRTKRYPLTEILFSAFIAILDGARSWAQISSFADSRLDLLRKFLPFENGIATDDTYSRVFSAIKPESLEAAFRQFAQDLVRALGKPTSLINIDGKQMRGATAASGVTVHILSAWCHDCGLSLGQLRIADKSNEIPSIPVLLDQLDISGKTITIDAMGTQKAIAKKIHDEDAHYVLALKGNQGSLEENGQEIASNYRPIDTFTAPPELAKGCVYERSAQVFNIPRRFAHLAENWPGICRIVKITCITTNKKKGVPEDPDIRYYISNNKEFTAEQFLNATRHHWGIENGCHWHLDVSFDEDASRKYAGFSSENFSRMLRLCLNAVKSVKFESPKDNKLSVICKCKKLLKSDKLISHLLYGIAA